MRADASPEVRAPRSPTRRALSNVVLIVASTLLTFMAIEGGASALVFVRDGWTKRTPPALLPHEIVDTLLGWTGRAGFADADAFGRGVGLTIGAQGLRGARSVQDQTPPGSTRIACSGDAFTLGLGVDDDHTWCARLEAEMPRVESVNLAQARYGLDQARARFERDGARFAPALHVVALTRLQLERALEDDVDGQPKGVLALEGTRVVTRGVPVREHGAAQRTWASLERAVDDLRIVRLARRAWRPAAGMNVLVHWSVFDAAIGAMAAEERLRGTRLVLAYLPGPLELSAGAADAVRAKLEAAARAHGVPLVDLTLPMRKLRTDSQDLAFISAPLAGAPPGLVGQYSNIGHRWVARELAVQLRPLVPSEPPPR